MNPEQGVMLNRRGWHGGPQASEGWCWVLPQGGSSRTAVSSTLCPIPRQEQGCSTPLQARELPSFFLLKSLRGH